MTVSHLRPRPLDEHELGHVLTEMADQEKEDGATYTRDGWREILIEAAGYNPRQVDQIFERWFRKCSACGDRDATHLWAGVGEDGSISSMEGPKKFALSCDECSGSHPSEFTDSQQGILRAPLTFDPNRIGLVFGDHVDRVAEWLCDRQSDTLGTILCHTDPGYAREILAKALKMFAREMAIISQNEIHQVTFDEVVLDILVDARTVA